jgi:hypothetical protein
LRGHTALDFHCAARGIHSTCEFDQQAVTSGLDDPATMRRDRGVKKRLSERLELRKGAFFVAAHQTAVPGDIRRQYSRQSPFNAFVSQNAPKGDNLAKKYQSIRDG